MLFKKLYGLCVATMFDIGAALIITYFYPFPNSPSILLFVFSIIVVLLPDIDILFKTVKDSTHRSFFTHQPLIMFIIGLCLGLLGILNYGLPWVVILYIPLLWLAHFIHDTIGSSGSLAWLAPFKQTHFWIVAEPVRSHWLSSSRITIKKQQSPNTPLNQWLKNYYHFTVEAFFSWLVFLIGLSLALSVSL